MTHEETRAMIIEIERRLQTMDPTMQIQNKIETDDIVSFLKQYQNMFIKDVYLSKSKAMNDKRLSSKLNDYLSTLYTKQPLQTNIDRDGYTVVYTIPSEYLSYIDSTSTISSTLYIKPTNAYKVHNEYIDNIQDINNIINEVYNVGFIMRKPVITVSQYNDERTLTLFHDTYTSIINTDLFYIRTPQPITLDDNSACELPYECFDDLVQGTVDLYVSTKYKLSQPKAKNKQALTNFANLLDEAKKQEDEE